MSLGSLMALHTPGCSPTEVVQLWHGAIVPIVPEADTCTLGCLVICSTYNVIFNQRPSSPMPWPHTALEHSTL